MLWGQKVWVGKLFWGTPPLQELSFLLPTIPEAPKLVLTHLCVKQGILALHEEEPVFRPGSRIDNDAAKFSADIRMVLQKFRFLKQYPINKAAVGSGDLEGSKLYCHRNKKEPTSKTSSKQGWNHFWDNFPSTSFMHQQGAGIHSETQIKPHQYVLSVFLHFHSCEILSALPDPQHLLWVLHESTTSLVLLWHGATEVPQIQTHPSSLVTSIWHLYPQSNIGTQNIYGKGYISVWPASFKCGEVNHKPWSFLDHNTTCFN